MPLDRFTNTDEVFSKTPTFGDTFSPDDLALIGGDVSIIPLRSKDVNGISPITTVEVEKHYYSQNTLLGSSYATPLNVSGNDSLGYTIYVKPEEDIRAAGYFSGTYDVVYNFFHNVSGVKVSEISANRKEVKLTSTTPNGLGSFKNLFQGTTRSTENSFVDSNKFLPAHLNFGNNSTTPILNAEFFGVLGGTYQATLDYPGEGGGLVWYPVSDRVLEQDFGPDNESEWQTFVEVDLNDSVTIGAFTNVKVTGRFDKFKLVRNPDSTLFWVRKGDPQPLSPEEVPADVPESLRTAADPNASIYTGVANKPSSIQYRAFDRSLQSVDQVIVKLYTPLPDSVRINDTLKISLELLNSYIERIIVYPEIESTLQTPFFSDPNYKVEVETNKGSSGEFESWTTLLDANYPTNQKIIDKLFSGSLGNTKLNIDYSDFKNFVNFSSATERVENFVYKIQEIERYNSRIELLEGVSGSDALTNISSSKTRRDNLIGGFDDFEYWMYYNNDSSLYSHYSSSAFTIEPYPKVTRVPHTLYDFTSSNATDWYNSVIDSASVYDAQNPNRLRNIIPVSIQEGETNSEYVTFVDMLGQHFDISWNYIKSIISINQREEHPLDGVSNGLLEVIANSMGWKLYNGYSDTSLWQYEFGVNSDGSPIQSGSLYSKSTKLIVEETWRRLVNNLPDIYKSKGTARSFKTLLSSYGIPQAFLKLREYGGPRIQDDKNQYEHERFVYKLQASPSKYISNPWDDIQSDRPDSIEVIGKLPKQNYHILRLNSTGGNIDCYWDYDSDEQTARIRATWPNGAISSSYVPYVNRREVVFTLNSSSIDIRAAWVDDWGNVLANPTASKTGTDSDFEGVWSAVGTVRVPGPTTDLNVNSYETASIQEIRYYRDGITNEIVEAHAKNREAYFSDDNTTDLDIDTSYDKLMYRIFPDSSFTTNTSSISSIHPNQKFTSSDSGLVLSASLVNMKPLDLVGEVDTQFVTIPSAGALNLSNKKVRVESSSLRGPLQVDKSNELSQYDFASTDSNLLGTYFSTTDTVNFDIYASEGYFEIDDLIGDTDVRNNDGYDDLDYRARNYFQKYTSATALGLILDILSRYDMSIFDSMKQLLPARVDWHKGILIEPHIFERNNYKRPEGISYTKHAYENDDSPIGIVSIITGSYDVYTSSIASTPFNASIYKYEDIQRLSSSGEYFSDTNPYWEYSPTGSTILKARPSLVYTELEFFYSTEESASKGVDFANSSSYVYAEVQDTRLSLAMENLLYNGCKVTSDSLTTDSLDTPDGEPVIVVTAVDPNTLIYSTTGVGVGSGRGAGSGRGSGKPPKTIEQVKKVPVEDLVAVQQYIKTNERTDTVNKGTDIASLRDILQPRPILAKKVNIRPLARPATKQSIQIGLGSNSSPTQQVSIIPSALNAAIDRGLRNRRRRQYRDRL